MSAQNTYWNNNGKFQLIYDELSKLIPDEGKCPQDKPALEKLRRAANMYYDLYNNGLCDNGSLGNYSAEEFNSIFDRSPADKDGVEASFSAIIVNAALENGFSLTKI